MAEHELVETGIRGGHDHYGKCSCGMDFQASDQWTHPDDEVRRQFEQHVDDLTVVIRTRKPNKPSQNEEK